MSRWINSIDQFSFTDPEVIPGKIAVSIPCLSVMMAKRDLVVANTYNPNSVPPDRLELLRTSIVENGFCFPCVTILDPDLERFVIIDGFHRYLVSGPDWLDLQYVPIVCLKHGIQKRMTATMQFNRARGIHQIDLDADIVRALIQQGMTDAEVAVQLGMDEDTVHRYKQLTGIAELFANVQYSTAWEMQEDANQEPSAQE
jgi:ParB-like chromosome segregation protein Spo0J